MKTDSPILFLDGGLGTSLEDKYGFKFSSASTPLWSSHLIIADEDQQTLLACQRDFGAVPVDVIETATYQTSFEGFSRTKTAEHPDGIPLEAIAPYLKNAVRVAEAARGGPDAQIAYSLGPYGACMIPGEEYSGRYDAEHDGEGALHDWWQSRLSLIHDPGIIGRIGYVAVETIPRLDEIAAVRRAVEDTMAGIGAPFWISCVFPGDGESLPGGGSVAEAVGAMLRDEPDQAQPWGIGINCTKVDKVERLVERYEAAVEGVLGNNGASGKGRKEWPALVLYPDGTNGEVYNTTTQKWEVPVGQTAPKVRANFSCIFVLFLYENSSSNPSQIPWEQQLGRIVLEASKRRRWSSILVGGCCKASHNDIKKLVEFVNASKSSTPAHS